MNFLVGDVNLEADNISVLYFTLSEGVFWLHKLDHAGFDFLEENIESACHTVNDAQSPTSKSFNGVPDAHLILSLMIGIRSLTLLALGIWILPIPKSDCLVVSKCLRKTMIVPALSNWIFFAYSCQRRNVPTDEINTYLGRIWEDIEVQTKVTLLSHGHVVADHLNS